ncbi:hypothetical protein LJC63_00440 [Ruminococcaceae bacterium OttesenSCG-928-L11]|nr:hypothetical protein [Ruminococcaceae bacterium OttesenSCG-928-L11]
MPCLLAAAAAQKNDDEDNPAAVAAEADPASTIAAAFVATGVASASTVSEHLLSTPFYWVAISYVAGNPWVT